MYPEITPHIRELIKFRYRLIPYLYDLLWRSHTNYEPMIRPTLYDFPDDARCFDENDEMMLGGKLLVASVVEPGQRERQVYLPRGCAWIDFWSSASALLAARRSAWRRRGTDRRYSFATARSSRSTWPSSISLSRPTSVPSLFSRRPATARSATSFSKTTG